MIEHRFKHASRFRGYCFDLDNAFHSLRPPGRHFALGFDFLHMGNAGAFLIANDLPVTDKDGVVADALIVQIFRHLGPDLIVDLPILLLFAGNQTALPKNFFHRGYLYG